MASYDDPMSTYIQHPEDYAQKCNAAMYNPNDYCQTAGYAVSASGLGGGMLGGLAQQAMKQQQAKQASGLGQAIQKKTLQDEAAQVRSLSEQLSGMLSQLEYAVFEPTPSLDGCQLNTKDNPSTVEGSIQTAVRTLQTAQYTLERILAKIGGR